MATLTVKDIPDDLYRRIQFYAMEKGTSEEAAVCQLLDDATRPAEKLGDIVAEIAREHSIEFPRIKRDQSFWEPAVYE